MRNLLEELDARARHVRYAKVGLAAAVVLGLPCAVLFAPYLGGLVQVPLLGDFVTVFAAAAVAAAGASVFMSRFPGRQSMPPLSRAEIAALEVAAADDGSRPSEGL